MRVADLNNPGERKKLIWAGILGFVAIVFLWWTFFGFGGSRTPQRPTTTTPVARQTAVNKDSNQQSQALAGLAGELREVNIIFPTTNVPEPKRNIFAYYEPPPPAQQVATPTPTPTPTPPVLLASMSPSNVYARTTDFTLEISGDKFTPALKIYLDGREMPTKYRSPQQLSTVVPAASIANPGVRQVVVRSNDGKVYSNTAALSVAPPPTPNYTYVGLIDTVTRVSTALLQDKNNKEILSVQRGDLLSGRFRVTSISEKELVMMDTNLKIKHTLAMTEGERGSGSPLSRPTPKVDAEDDEP